MNIELVEDAYGGKNLCLGEMILLNIDYKDYSDWDLEPNEYGEFRYVFNHNPKLSWKVSSYMRGLNGDLIGGEITGGFKSFEEARDYAYKYALENLEIHLKMLKMRNPAYRRLKSLAEKNEKYIPELNRCGDSIIKLYTKI